jgi:hypothetical protein
MRKKETKTAGIFPFVIECMCLHISEKESLSYLKDRGFTISRVEFYRLKKEVQESTQERLNLIASKEFLTQRMERIDTLRVILKEMWLNYHIENNPSKKVQILEEIEENQIYLSSYYDSMRFELQRAANKKDKITVEI